MKAYRFFWDTHKWTGIVLAVFLVMIASTGLVLLVKKQFDWILPPVQKGEPGGLEEFITLQQLLAVVFAQGRDEFRSLDDIDRLDFRPHDRICRVRSIHDHAEMQVDVISGEVLSHGWRGSDFFESIHDGSIFGKWFHDWVMPIVPFGLLFLVGSGLYLWLQPLLRRKRRARHIRQGASVPERSRADAIRR